MLYHDLKILIMKETKNSVKDMTIEEHPNNLMKRYENKRNSEKTQEEEICKSTKLIFHN